MSRMSLSDLKLLKGQTVTFEIVDHFEDIKIKIVDHFEDLRVEKTTFGSGGKEIKVKIVDCFEDAKIKIVDWDGYFKAKIK